MKIKYLIALCLPLIAALISCGSTKKSETADNQSSENNKILVAYFSATGTTRDAATKIAEIAQAELIEIAPESRYSDADLDWRDSTSRCYVEMHNRDMRPAIADTIAGIENYDVIYIGYPNWWNTAPTIINTFIERHNLKGKRIVPFMTSGGDDITNSEKDLHEAYPEINWGDGLLMNNVDDKTIKEWIEKTL